MHRADPNAETFIRKAPVKHWPVSDAGTKENELGYYIHIPVKDEDNDYVGVVLSQADLFEMLVAIQRRFNKWEE